MEPATRFLYGADVAATLAALAYIVTVHHAWREVANGAFWWALCGAALLAVLDGGAWWMLHRDAKLHAQHDAPPEEAVTLAGRFGAVDERDSRRAA